MNPKLIIASIAGVSALGGGVAGCYYYFKTDTSNSEKQTNDTLTSESLESTSPKPEGQENSVQSGSSPAKPTAGPESPKTNVKGPTGSSPENIAGRDSSASLQGAGGLAEVGASGSRGESGSGSTTTSGTPNRDGSTIEASRT